MCQVYNPRTASIRAPILSPVWGDVEEAQLAKKRHLTSKLVLSPGQQILDIGSGWGELLSYLDKVEHCDVTGVTLSREQTRIFRARAAKEGLSRAVHFDFRDYRNLKGTFDRIISVGMFEHIGVNLYNVFQQAAQTLDR